MSRFRAQLPREHRHLKSHGYLKLFYAIDAELSGYAGVYGHRRLTRPEVHPGRHPVQDELAQGCTSVGVSDLNRDIFANLCLDLSGVEGNDGASVGNINEVRSVPAIFGRERV